MYIVREWMKFNMWDCEEVIDSENELKHKIKSTKDSGSVKCDENETMIELRKL